jgi:hypothetical protein
MLSVTDVMVLPFAAVAEALTVIVPLTVAPLLGEVNETALGSLFTVMLSDAVPLLALASVAVTVIVWAPLLSAVVSRLKL